MSEDKLYMETGELPPQGIGPDKDRKYREQMTTNEIVDFIRRYEPDEIESIVVDDKNVLIRLSTDWKQSYDKHMGDSLKWTAHWLVRNLEIGLDVFDLHEDASVDINLVIPRRTFTKTPATSEQEGVGDED